MKRLLFIFILISGACLGQNSSITKDIATVKKWIIYQGDTLTVASIHDDTLFTEKGTQLDTLIMSGVNYWTLEGDDIGNNNSGDVNLYGRQFISTVPAKFEDTLLLYPLPPEATPRAIGRVLGVETDGMLKWSHWIDGWHEMRQEMKAVGERPTDSCEWAMSYYFHKGDAYFIDSINYGAYFGVELNASSAAIEVGDSITIGYTCPKQSDCTQLDTLYMNKGVVLDVINGVTTKVITDANTYQSCTIPGECSTPAEYGFISAQIFHYTCQENESLCQWHETSPDTITTRHHVVVDSGFAVRYKNTYLGHNRANYGDSGMVMQVSRVDTSAQLIVYKGSPDYTVFLRAGHNNGMAFITANYTGAIDKPSLSIGIDKSMHYNQRVNLYEDRIDLVSDSLNMNSPVYFSNFIKLTPRATPPSPAQEGMIYPGTDHKLYYYNGTAWKEIQFVP